MQESSHKLTQVDSILYAKWILPVLATDSPTHTQLYHQHAIVIKDQKIHAIVPHSDAERYFQAKESVDLSQHLLMPGLINAHAHSAMVLFRGMADDLALMDWLENHIWPNEQRWVNEQFVREGTQLAIAEMLLSGTTCFADMYFFPDIAAEVANECGIRALLHCPIIDVPTNWAKTPDEYLEKAIDLAKRFQKHPRIEIGLGPHAPYTVSDDTFRKVLAAKEQYQLKVQIHLHETQFEVDSSLQHHQMRPIARLDQLGFLFEHLQAVHMTALTPEEIDLMSAKKVSIIHCPQSNLKLASGFCPVHALTQKGVTVALGTDGASSNNDLDLFSEMQTAALIAKAVSHQPQAMPAIEAVKTATLQSARALQLHTRIGSLEVGKEADCIAIDFSDLSMFPCYNPVSHLVYSAVRQMVTHVWVQGVPLVKERQFTEHVPLNPETLKYNAQRWYETIRSPHKFESLPKLESPPKLGSPPK